MYFTSALNEYDSKSHAFLAPKATVFAVCLDQQDKSVNPSKMLVRSEVSNACF